MSTEPFTTENLPTPALVIEGGLVRANIHRLAEYASAHGLKVRPHTKTHKSKEIAKLQLESGSAGLTVAKVGEAEVMAEVSDDLLLAYPVVDAWRAQKVAQLARNVVVRVALDSKAGVEALSRAATAAGSTVGILVDLDVGLGRTGVQSHEAALELAQHVNTTRGVRLDGIMCYPGHIWDAPEKQSPALAEVSTRLQEILDDWSKHGLCASIVSGGSTPTAYQSHLISQITEIRPGTYVFNDMNTVLGGYCRLEDCAARIICTVISSAVPQQVVVDAGSKTLTSDRSVPAPNSGYGFVLEYPQAKIVKLTEEHAQIDISACENNPRLGERLTIIPNHICPCINLQDRVWWRNPDGLLCQIDIHARGKTV